MSVCLSACLSVRPSFLLTWMIWCMKTKKKKRKNEKENLLRFPYNCCAYILFIIFLCLSVCLSICLFGLFYGFFLLFMCHCFCLPTNPCNIDSKLVTDYDYIFIIFPFYFRLLLVPLPFLFISFHMKSICMSACCCFVLMLL